MLPEDLRLEAERQFTVCNACRYCEGLCSVFPAMELRTAFASGDVTYLGNLCHDCRACVQACPFTPPHEMAIDLSTLLSTVRQETFELHARPQRLWRLLTRPRALATLIVAGVVLVFGLAIAIGDPGRIVRQPRGQGSFYDIVAYVWMVIPAGIAAILALAAIIAGLVSFVREGGSQIGWLRDGRAHALAFRDVLGLRNMRGGGGGCHVDDDRPTAVRRRLHFLVFYGFGLMFLATVAAAVEQELFDIQPPYGLLSAPVVLGLVGGIATLVGCGGFLAMGLRAGGARKVADARRIDRLFTVMLILTTATGLLVLSLRATVALGPTLLFHLALVGGFLLTLPYSKFVHGAYRYAALVRYHAESREPSLARVSPRWSRPRAEPAPAIFEIDE